VGGSRSVALATLLSRLETPLAVTGDCEVSVNAIEIDSRLVKPGALFVALRGEHTDGHRYAEQAVANGARALVVETELAALPAGVTLVRAADTRRALSALAAAFYGDPSRALDVIGVTGTNGKTITTHLIAAILNAANRPCGIAGTVGGEFGTHRWLLDNTTPLPPELHRLLAQMREHGAKAVAMEVSSHALALRRVDDVRFRIAALTNLTRDHLDFHRTRAAYAAAKRRLFSLAPACVINADDEYGRQWASQLQAEGRAIVTYGSDPGAGLVPRAVTVDAKGSRFTLDGQSYDVRIPGRFNVWNALAALGVARLFGIDDATAARGIASVERVPGRMERFDTNGVIVVVDYAHTPDALENVLRSLRETARAKLAVVFGCGGDRDRGKRREMGAVAAHLADRVYVTSDNPRSEAPGVIAEAIVAGIGPRDHVVELDRRRAIERAIAEAQPGDVVLIAGKGHEPYQIVGERIHPFDDGLVAREALSRRPVLR
jgi:UDP-N-acetylmuramoyl-L-alanyl-D-glutamate--2,6-diaminopimelate ligase